MKLFGKKILMSQVIVFSLSSLFIIYLMYFIGIIHKNPFAFPLLILTLVCFWLPPYYNEEKK